MNKHFTTILLLSCAIATQSAYADLLCMRRVVLTEKKSVPLASAFRVAATKCPNGFNEILDTDDLTGASGDSGTPLVSYSGCSRRTSTHTKVNSAPDDSRFSYAVTCNTGEYAYSTEETITYTYSNDWQYGGDDSSMAGKSYTAPPRGNTFAPDLLDANGISSGFTLFVGGLYVTPTRETGLTVFTGALTTTANVKLLCCKTGR